MIVFLNLCLEIWCKDYIFIWQYLKYHNSTLLFKICNSKLLPYRMFKSMIFMFFTPGLSYLQKKVVFLLWIHPADVQLSGMLDAPLWCWPAGERKQRHPDCTLQTLGWNLHGGESGWLTLACSTYFSSFLHVVQVSSDSAAKTNAASFHLPSHTAP